MLFRSRKKTVRENNSIIAGMWLFKSHNREVIEMKNKRLTYNEARIEALLKHIEELNIEILELEFKLKQAQNAINE